MLRMEISLFLVMAFIAYMCYAGAAFYLALCTWLLDSNRKRMDQKEKIPIFFVQN